MNGIGRRASLLAIAATVAVALLGSAYTLWFERVPVNIVASTSSLDATILCLQPAENETNAWPDPSYAPFFAAYPKAATLKQVADASITPSSDVHQAQVVITGAYPGYAWDCELHVTNVAGVPWHIEDMQFTVEKCNSDGLSCTPLTAGLDTPKWTTTCVIGGNCSWGNEGINPSDYPRGLSTWTPLYMEIEDREGCQRHEGFGIASSFMVGVNQSAEENVQYKLVLTYQVNQWNESDWNGCESPKPNT
jgi:hypothetical protein